jgi:hypothetical protein
MDIWIWRYGDMEIWRYGYGYGLMTTTTFWFVGRHLGRTTSTRDILYFLPYFSWTRFWGVVGQDLE